jgi:hypothetical protein
MRVIVNDDKNMNTLADSYRTKLAKEQSAEEIKRLKNVDPKLADHYTRSSVLLTRSAIGHQLACKSITDRTADSILIRKTI